MECSKKTHFNARRKTTRFLTQSEEALIDQCFRLFDQDQDGTIDLRELKTAIRALGFPMKKCELHERLEMHGQVNEAQVDFDAFRTVVRDLIVDRDPVVRLREVFSKLDIDGTGKITSRALKRLSKLVGLPIEDEELEDMIDQFDRNNVGSIDFEDFQRIMKTDEDSE